MMKKILSIIMSICMLLTLVAVPVNVFATEAEDAAYEESTLGSYYLFTFGEDGDQYNYVNSSKTLTDTTGQVTYKGDTFYPLWSYGAANTASAQYKTITTSDGVEVDVLEIKNTANAFLTPLTKEGKPFEMKPGVEYTITLSGYNPASNCWGQSAFYAGGSSTKSQETVNGLSKGAAAENKLSEALRWTGGGAVGGSAFSIYLKDGTYSSSGTAFTVSSINPEYSETGISANKSVSGRWSKQETMSIPEDYSAGYNAEKNSYSTKFTTTAGAATTEDDSDDYAYGNNYFTLSISGGNALNYKTSAKYPVYTNATKDELDALGTIPSCWQISSIEIYETGKGVANLHVGDTVTKVADEAGTAIDLSIPEAPEGKYFVAWYTDAEYTTPVTSAQTIVEGTSLDFYARFEEYGSYVKNDYTSNTYPDTVIQQTSAGYYYAARGYSYKGNSYVYGTTDSTLKTKDCLVKELEAKGYATTPESGTLVFFSDRTWDQQGGIVAYNEDGTLFMPEAGAQYKVTYRYRSLLNNGNDMAINITYGILDTFVNTSSTLAKTPHKSTLKYNTLADVVPEWTVKSEVVTIPATATGYVPAIGLYIAGVKKVAVYAEDGTTVTGYTHTVVELDYLEVEKLKNVTFTAADGSTSTGAYANGEAITYPELTDGDWYEAMWSLSKDEYIEVPETMGDTDITVYEFRKKVKNIITCINGSTTSYAYAAAGEDIAYPALTASFNYDYVWSLSEDSYSSAPVKAGSEDITVYAYQNPVISFENYPVCTDSSDADTHYNAALPYDNEQNSQVTTEDAYTGTHSMKLRDVYVQYITTEPDDWATAWTNYYEYNAETGKWTKLTDEEAPAFEAYKYGKWRNAVESGMTVIEKFDKVDSISISYKISFKYKATANNKGESTFTARLFPYANIWWGAQTITGTFTFPAGATDGWQTGEMYVTVSDFTNVTGKSFTTAGYNFVLDLKWDGKGTQYAKEIYVDDIVITKDYANTPTVIFHDGETVTEVTEGVTAGAAYTPALVGTNAPEGLSFKGWSTTADGLNIVDTVTMPAATVICKVDLYAVYGADPTIVYHDNGVETVIEEGIEGGAEYVIDRVGAGVEGKYFAGWATTENGTSYVSKITVTEAGDAKNHLYAVYIAYPDNVTYDVTGATQPTLQGYPTLTDGVISDIALTESGWAQKKYTADGLIFEKALGGANKWNPALDGTSNSHGQTSSRSDLIASTEDNPVGTQVYGGWGANSNYVLRDKNGNAVIAKENTKYAVIVTYEKTGNGKQSLGVGMGRQAGYVSLGANATSVGTYNRFYSSTHGFSDDPKIGETKLVFNVTTKEFTEGDVPVISLHYGGEALIMERVAADDNGVESYTLANGTTYYPYKIIEAPSILIKSVEIIEIDSGNVGVTFMRYDAEKEAFIPEFKEGTPGAALDVDTHNYDPKWYNSSTRITGAEVVTTYPSSDATYYNATYGQLNPVAGTFVTGNGFKNGGEEKQWIFENTLYDGKYALHIGDAKVAIAENDVETYMTGVKLEQGHTYKVSFKYKATAAHSKFGFIFKACQSDNFWSAGDNATKGSVSVAAGDATDGWVTKNVYFTADFAGTVTDENETGLDYNVTRESRRILQMAFTQDANEAGNDLYFADIEVIDLGDSVIAEGGASVLTEEVAIIENKQAMRFYFSYKTDDGSNIYVGDDVLTVVERGFYYRNGYVANGGTVATMYTAAVKQNKTDNFNTCWAYDEATGKMTFSTYITGFGLNDDDRKLEVNAYIIVETADGDRYTIYADSINRTVAGVKDAGGATDNDFFAGS